MANSVFLAEVDSTHFSFRAIGLSDEDARKALLETLLAHKKKHDLDIDFITRYGNMDDFSVSELKMGYGYCDHDEYKLD